MTEAEIIEALGAVARVRPMTTFTTPMAGAHREATETVFTAPLSQEVEGMYEKLVKMRRAWIGKNPDDWVLGDRPWGAPLDGTPFIAHHGELYLPVLVNEVLHETFYIGKAEVPRALFPTKETRRNQGLPKELEVVFHNYKIEDIRHLGGQGI